MGEDELDALKRREQTFREAIDGARCVLWEARVDKRPDGQFGWKLNILSPESTRREFGFIRAGADSDNETYSQHIPPDEMKRMNETSFRALSQGEPGYHQEFCIYAADGKLRYMSEYVRITPTEPGEFHLVGVQVDITERRRAEEALKRSEEQLVQARTMEAVGQFAAGAAQYFGNLMKVVKGYSTLMLQSLEKNDPQRKNIDVILKVVARSEELNEQLNALGRSETVKIETLDLNEVVGETYRLLQPLVKNDIAFHLLLSTEPGRVRASRSQIEQALISMAINARQAMPSGGKLIFETLNVDLSEATARTGSLAPGKYVMLAVSDTGTGMDESVRSRLFEPFFSTKGLARGTGLGLATAYTFVRHAGGDIDVASQPGKGTRFRIYLPRVND